MTSYVPAGWPSAVHPPGSDSFEASAVGWLLDVLPPGYREQKRVHRYPIGLAVIARHHAEASVTGARQGYRAIRAELRACLPADEIDEVLAAYGAQGARLVTAARSIDLVERALRGDLPVVPLILLDE
jgi:hypothetical protein